MVRGWCERATKWTPASMLDNNRLWRYQNSPNVCGRCDEEQENDQLLCLEQIWMCAVGSSLVFQWCGCSRNSPEGEAAPCTSRSCFSSRVWLHLCLLANGSPHIKNGAAALKERLHGVATFSCSEKIILSHPFLISFLWCSWCSDYYSKSAIS